ncbi:MAG: arginine--tRNA ligase, partial [Sedimentisphaerales bacterium]
MKSVARILEEKISAAMTAVTGQRDCAAIVGLATDPKFGDYQANGVMALAKKVKAKPRKLAEEVVKKLDIRDICEQPEVAGPGFINLRLKPDFIADRLLKINADPEGRLGIEKTAKPKTIVVDFSCPNIAKQMHVGHLRSTIIGDCICRILEFLGHKVIRQNHIGDWGTHFGMLCTYFDQEYLRPVVEQHPDEEAFSIMDDSLHIRDIDSEQFYREAKKLFDTDPKFADRSRQYVVKLQTGDEHVLSVWDHIVHESLVHCEEVYRLLNVNLTRDDVRGESAYRDDLPMVVEDLRETGLAKESDGAICIFPPGFKNKEGQPLPFMIQKSDGAYLYA